MSIGHRIGLQLSRALVRQNAGLPRRDISVAAFKLQSGGDLPESICEFAIVVVGRKFSCL